MDLHLVPATTCEPADYAGLLRQLKTTLASGGKAGKTNFRLWAEIRDKLDPDRRFKTDFTRSCSLER